MSDLNDKIDKVIDTINDKSTGTVYVRVDNIAGSNADDKIKFNDWFGETNVTPNAEFTDSNRASVKRHDTTTRIEIIKDGLPVLGTFIRELVPKSLPVGKENKPWYRQHATNKKRKDRKCGY